MYEMMVMTIVGVIVVGFFLFYKSKSLTNCAKLGNINNNNLILTLCFCSCILHDYIGIYVYKTFMFCIGFNYNLCFSTEIFILNFQLSMMLSFARREKKQYASTHEKPIPKDI